MSEETYDIFSIQWYNKTLTNTDNRASCTIKWYIINKDSLKPEEKSIFWRYPDLWYQYAFNEPSMAIVT